METITSDLCVDVTRSAFSIYNVDISLRSTLVNKKIKIFKQTPGKYFPQIFLHLHARTLERTFTLFEFELHFSVHKISLISHETIVTHSISYLILQIIKPFLCFSLLTFQLFECCSQCIQFALVK